MAHTNTTHTTDEVDRANLLVALVHLVEYYRGAIIDGDLDADEIEAMDSDDGLVVDLNGQPIVLWLRDERDDRAVVAWLGNDIDPDMHHLVEAELDVEDGWRRLHSRHWINVMFELAELAGGVDLTGNQAAAIVDEFDDRGLIRWRDVRNTEIVEIRRMTEASFNRIVATAVGA